VSEAEKQQTGTVKAFNENGFGFIVADRGGADFWLRTANVLCDPLALRSGRRVGFDTHFGELGPEALNVRLLTP
jgi:cold shock CspA family protein